MRVGTPTEGLEALRDLSGGCPCCMLAAIRQSKLQVGYSDGETYSPGIDLGFHFASEMKAFWDGENQKYDY